MQKRTLTTKNRYSKCKKHLEETIKKGHGADPQIFLDFFKASLDLKATHHSGKVEPVQKDGITIAWVKYKDFDMELFNDTYHADAFLTTGQLEEFAANPFDFMLPEIEPQNIYIYGMFDSFEKDIAPHIVKLNQHGANTIVYFSWDFEQEQYTPIDAVEIIHNLVKMVREPALYKDFKRLLKSKCNGIYDIESLSYLKSLKRLAAVV